MTVHKVEGIFVVLSGVLTGQHSVLMLTFLMYRHILIQEIAAFS